MTDVELTQAAIAYLEAETGRTLNLSETAQAENRVRGALVLIRARHADTSLLDQGALAYVLGQVLIARASNPEGYQSETIDDYTYRHGSETRRVSILPEWWALLSPAGNSGAFSTRPGFDPDGGDRADLWWPVKP